MQSWAEQLPRLIEQATARWSLRLGAVYEPGGVTSWVAPARTPDGTDAVLKITWRHAEAAHEAAGLRAWDGRGAVRLYRHARLAADAEALLLERCRPGTPLTGLPEEEQDGVLVGLLRQLWTAPAVGPFRPLRAMCDAWAEALDVEAASAAVGDAGIVRAGLTLFRQLPRDPPARPVLLATDLHAANVLAAQRAPWLVIDPKPYVGDRTYDVLQHLLNCPRRLAADPHALVAQLAAGLDLERARLALWLFARCVVECAEQPRWAALARRLAPR
jgi:streptomycin 6-kinase